MLMYTPSSIICCYVNIISNKVVSKKCSLKMSYEWKKTTNRKRATCAIKT